MLFTTYVRRTLRLLRDQRVQVVNPGDIVDWVNEARSQLAGESECIVFMGSLAVTGGQTVYPFSAITLTGASGIGGILNVRTIWYQVGIGTGGPGQKWVRPRPWPWFSLYQLNNPVPTTGAPQIWSQYAQGVNGSLYLSPVPDIQYTLPVDCVCYPAPLVFDADPEAIPYQWTDAIPYYAAYLAMLSMETGGPTDEAGKMFDRYQQYVVRARRAATPSILPTNYAQIPSPVRQNQLGVQPQQRGAD